MRSGALVSTICVLALVGCDGSPTSPGPISSLALSQESLVLTRHGIAQLTVTAVLPNGVAEDVSALVRWTSSNPSVITVAGGQVIAVGIGTAEVHVTFGGFTKTAIVLVRRNLAIAGSMIVTDDDRRSISSVSLRVHGTQIAFWYAGSDHHGLREAKLNWVWQILFVNPGEFELQGEVWMWGGRTAVLVVDPIVMRVVDRDTEELLETIILERRQVTISSHGFFAIPVQVRDY